MATLTMAEIVSEASEPAQMRYRSLTAAREAFACADPIAQRELSREAHSLLRASASEPLEPGSPQARAATWSPFVISSEAGHVEELANVGVSLLLAGAQHSVVGVLLCASLGDAAGWPVALTLKISAALLLCGAAYAACQQALDTVTYSAYYERERKREAWEMDNFPEGEVEEMVQLYTKRGLPEHAARTVVTAMAASPDFFVDVMMLEELQMSPPPQISPVAAALRSGSGMLLSAGPLLLGGLLYDHVMGGAAWHAYVLLVLLSAVALCCLGSLRASITHQKRAQLAMQTCALVVPGLLLARLVGGMLLAGGVGVAAA